MFAGLIVFSLLIKLRKDWDFREIVLRFAGRGELAEVEGFALGGEVALAGGPVAGATPVFLEVEEEEEQDEEGEESSAPD